MTSNGLKRSGIEHKKLSKSSSSARSLKPTLRGIERRVDEQKRSGKSARGWVSVGTIFRNAKHGTKVSTVPKVQASTIDGAQPSTPLAEPTRLVPRHGIPMLGTARGDPKYMIQSCLYYVYECPPWHVVVIRDVADWREN